MQKYGCINMFPITEMERKNGYFYQNQGSELIKSSMKKIIPIVSILLMVVLNVSGQTNNPTISTNGFKVIPLGVKGGLDESNLSAYLVAANGSDQYICLDAGTIYKGLELASANKFFKSVNLSSIQQQQIHGYFISHAHLDHTAGLIMNSPNDNAKNLYGLASVLDVFKKNYFTWSAWANFGSEGEAPILKKYSYQTLTPKVEIAINNTGLFVTPFVLSHVKPYESTAFLVRNQNSYLLYLGDTGADKVEQSEQLAALWKAVAPLVMNNQLKAIFIEASFDNSVPERALFGHLTPNLLMEEMSKLNQLSKGQLKNTPLYVTHIKPCDGCEVKIKSEIQATNQIGLKISYPLQASLIELK
jgi:3',5'-cyclic-nucleotide phosphodiesterase